MTGFLFRIKSQLEEEGQDFNTYEPGGHGFAFCKGCDNGMN